MNKPVSVQMNKTLGTIIAKDIESENRKRKTLQSWYVAPLLEFLSGKVDGEADDDGFNIEIPRFAQSAPSAPYMRYILSKYNQNLRHWARIWLNFFGIFLASYNLSSMANKWRWADYSNLFHIDKCIEIGLSCYICLLRSQPNDKLQ